MQGVESKGFAEGGRSEPQGGRRIEQILHFWQFSKTNTLSSIIPILLGFTLKLVISQLLLPKHITS